MAADIHVNDIGTELVVAIVDEDGAAVNLAAATVKTIRLKPPTGATLSKAAVLDTNGTDGLIRYDTVSGDLSTPGSWQIQGFVTVAGKSWSTEVGNFLVKKNLG